MNFSRDDREVRDERAIFDLAVPGIPQDRRRMNRGDNAFGEIGGKPLVAHLGDAEIAAEQALRGSRSEADDDRRPEQLDLGPEPGQARIDLAGPRLFVNSAFAALFELEMFDRVR